MPGIGLRQGKHKEGKLHWLLESDIYIYFAKELIRLFLRKIRASL